MEGRPMTGNYKSGKGRESCDWKQESTIATIRRTRMIVVVKNDGLV